MRAMLLAAGLGSRLRPLTADRPKCMLPVAGKPILQWNIEWLRKSGVRDVVVNLHHRPEAVTGYFGDGGRLGVHIQYSYEAPICGTAGAVRVARLLLGSGQFAVLYADNIIRCDLDRLESLHSGNHAVMTMALFWRTDVRSSGVAVLDTDDRIVGFDEKPEREPAGGAWVNAGLLLCDPCVIDYIPTGYPSDFGRDVLPAIVASGHVIRGYRMGPDETLAWIDTPEDLAATRSRFAGAGASE